MKGAETALARLSNVGVGWAALYKHSKGASVLTLRRRGRTHITRAAGSCRLCSAKQQRKAARMAAALAKEPEIVDESDGDEEITEDAYDVLESALCGEYGADGHTVNMSQSVKNDVKNAQRAAHKAANIGLCQDTRATTEQVLDPRTRLILFKLLQRNAFSKLEGCLSTGKEANVYYALSGDGLRDIEATKDVPSNSPLAVKVYKTSILVFRDRRRYVDGEHRFEKGYTSGKNPRKMVQLWAEKELRNYKRLHVL